MYNRPEQILEQYALEVNSIAKSREGFLCDTSQGLKLLKEYQGSKERAAFLMQMLQFLESCGILTEKIWPTREGKPLAQSDEQTGYLLCDAMTGSECDTKSRDDMLAAVKTLAKFHNAAAGYGGEIPPFVKTGEDSLLKLYEKHNRELNKVKNYVRGRKKKNEFELLFSQCYADYIEKAGQVTRLLEQTKLCPQSVGFCHGDYNQHNVIFTKNGIAIVHFDRFTYHISVSDLANFMRKMLEKNNWNMGLGIDMIRAYEKIHPLEKQEMTYLYIYLAYPEKFWKVANHYYNAHKAWISGRNIEKLQKVVAQEEKRSSFLQMLFSFL